MYRKALVFQYFRSIHIVYAEEAKSQTGDVSKAPWIRRAHRIQYLFGESIAQSGGNYKR